MSARKHSSARGCSWALEHSVIHECLRALVVINGHERSSDGLFIFPLACAYINLEIEFIVVQYSPLLRGFWDEGKIREKNA